MKTLMVALIAVCTFSHAARAEETVPSVLIIGYEDEGKVDASPQACLAHVREVTEWDKAATERGAKEVCAARKHHADAYAELQSNYKIFVEEFSKDRRLDLPAAVANLKTLIKACMDHKSDITTGGHNISINIIANEIDAHVPIPIKRTRRARGSKAGLCDHGHFRPMRSPLTSRCSAREGRVLRFFANAFRTILVAAIVVLAIALVPIVGKAFAHSGTTNSVSALNEPVVNQSCAAFEAWFLDPACGQAHVKKAPQAKHRAARK
jgi:hypothetical protein